MDPPADAGGTDLIACPECRSAGVWVMESARPASWSQYHPRERVGHTLHAELSDGADGTVNQSPADRRPVR